MDKYMDGDVDRVTAYLTDGDIDYLMTNKTCPNCHGLLVDDTVSSCIKVNGVVLEYKVVRCESCGKVVDDNA